MSTQIKLNLLLALAVATLGLPIFGAGRVAADIITPTTLADINVWGDTDGNAHFIAIHSLLPPMDVITLTPVAPENIQAPDARPFAVLNAVTAKTAKAAGVMFMPKYASVLEGPQDATPLEELDLYGAYSGETLISFGFVACLKYMLPEGVVLVTTVQPSATALRLKLVLGDTPITLANGTPAWATENVAMNIEGVPMETLANREDIYFPNRVTWAQGELLITVASALPLARLQELANEVVMK